MEEKAQSERTSVEEEARLESPVPADETSERETSDPETPAEEAGAKAEAEAAPPEPEPLVREGMQWYVLRVASNLEDRVREALDRKIKIEKLENRIGRVLVPTQKEKRMRGGRARIYYRKLYPGYVFVEMATEADGSVAEDVWFMIKETSGVGDFISSGGKPSPMSMTEVEQMLSAVIQPEEQPALANLKFNKGDKVKVQEGPFENFEGVVDEINSHKGTVRVIVTIFGRATPIEMEYWQVETV
jgi:transcription termination/antitermination protein NusG